MKVEIEASVEDMKRIAAALRSDHGFPTNVANQLDKAIENAAPVVHVRVMP